jgi:hypothetical protein
LVPFWFSILGVCVGAHASDFTSKPVRNVLSLVGIHTLSGDLDGTILRLVADVTRSSCGTSRLGEVKVAIVRNSPIVTVLMDRI